MGIKIGFTCSTFDLLHAGHIMMLEEAKSVCDYLIVGLQVNPAIDRDYKHPPVQSVSERFIQLSGCKYVDEIIPYETEKDLELLLNMLQLDIRILGKEYQGQDFTGYDICKVRGIELYYNSRCHNLSTASLRKRVFNAEREKFTKRIKDTIPEPTTTQDADKILGIAEVNTSWRNFRNWRHTVVAHEGVQPTAADKINPEEC